MNTKNKPFKKEATFVDIGLRLRAIREELQLTADAVSKETGISRSYISDFERGYRLPTSKYLKYLKDRFNVNMNHIFSGESPVFLPTGKDAPPDFGSQQAEVDNMLRFMAKVPHSLFSMLASFSKYQIENKHLIEKHQSQKKEKAGE